MSVNQTSLPLLKVGSNGPVDPSALVDIVGTSGGFLGPRMTSAQRIAIPSPATGLEVYDLTVQAKYVYGPSGGWAQVGSGGGGGGGSGSVTSVGLSAPTVFTVSGSPVTGSGTLSFAANTQSANQFWSGPVSGSAATPTFRALASADIPSGNSGSVSSVALSLPGIFTVSGSPITGSGTLSAVLANESAAFVFAGPVSGSAAAPTFRAIVSTDIPTLNQNTTGTAGNITATTNSTITTLSNLSLPYGQLSGVVPTWNQSTTGNAANITATTNGTLTSLTALGTATSLVSVGAVSAGTWNATTVAVAHGGTGQTSNITAPAATTVASWDANKNLSANNLIPGFTTTATAAGTTTLTISSTEIQIFTGSTTQTVKLPTTSVVAGGSYWIQNLSSGAVTVQSSGANNIQVLAANTQGVFTALVATPTTAANWTCVYQTLGGTITAVAPTVQVFNQTNYYTFTITATTAKNAGQVYSNNSSQFTTVYATTGSSTTLVAYLSSGTNAPSASGTLTYVSGSVTGNITFSAVAANGTYQRPTGPTPLYIRVRMVGGGGGGAGTGTGAGTGGTGGATTFGSSLLTANGGSGGELNGGTPGFGGTASVATSATVLQIVALQGGSGGGHDGTVGGTPGGMGAASPFGGAGGGGYGAGGVAEVGQAAIANSGSGGGGASGPTGIGTGGGGCAGGYLEAILISPSATYTYTVGTIGTAGGGGSGGAAGGAGSTGYIAVEEFYQ